MKKHSRFVLRVGGDANCGGVLTKVNIMSRVRGLTDSKYLLEVLKALQIPCLSLLQVPLYNTSLGIYIRVR